MSSPPRRTQAAHRVAMALVVASTALAGNCSWVGPCGANRADRDHKAIHVQWTVSVIVTAAVQARMASLTLPPVIGVQLTIAPVISECPPAS